VRVTIFDSRGRRVRTLVDERQAPGTYTVAWDGRDSDGKQLASGVYFHRFEAAGKAHQGKMVLVK
jgi:flagellar hook assembly protein FlgD